MRNGRFAGCTIEQWPCMSGRASLRVRTFSACKIVGSDSTSSIAESGNFPGLCTVQAIILRHLADWISVGWPASDYRREVFTQATALAVLCATGSFSNLLESLFILLPAASFSAELIFHCKKRKAEIPLAVIF